MQILQLGSRGPDVLRLQQQLNRLVAPGARLVEDGVYGPGTVNAVMQFQRSKGLFPDGKAGPNTIAALTGNNSPSAQPTVGTAFNPSGMTFSQRLEAFLSDADSRYHVKVGKQATTRDPADAQKWHIAHMFYYNSFAGRKPAKNETENGHSVIQWAHISSPTLVWGHGVDWKLFLRDKSGLVPVKMADGKSWTIGHEPDKQRSRQAAFKILESAGIATSDVGRPHGAMVAPGYEGCGEPCMCGGHPSRHTAGLACDLNKQDLKSLEGKLTLAKAGSLDAYLKTFGLKRPMPSEPWHVEST